MAETIVNTVKVYVDPAALRGNLEVVRQLCPKSRVMAVIKADAYGHGLIAAADALRSADGFAVARLREALQLRRAGFTNRILLLGTLLEADELGVCSREEIDVTAHTSRMVDQIYAQARQNPLRVWLKLDSGMHRLGLSPDAFIQADRVLSGSPGVLELLHMTHFSSAGDVQSEVMERQMRCFELVRSKSSHADVSLANSAALICRRDLHREWVRPGIMLYGINPGNVRHPVQLTPAMTLCARMIGVRRVVAGESLGYNEEWVSTRPSIVGTVGIGYGDGYPRNAKCGTPVLINGQVASIIGRVSMDSLTIDLTDTDGVCIGDEVTLWGRILPASRVAEFADTIPYELFTSITSRVERESGVPAEHRSTIGTSVKAKDAFYTPDRIQTSRR
jgi:alanine racemase